MNKKLNIFYAILFIANIVLLVLFINSLLTGGLVVNTLFIILFIVALTSWIIIKIQQARTAKKITGLDFIVVLLFILFSLFLSFPSVFYNPVSHNTTSKLTVCKANILNLQKAVDEYNYDNKQYPESLNKLVPKYIRFIPQCPISNLQYCYEVTNKGIPAYTIYCKGSYHTDLGIKNGYPRYTSKNAIIENGK